MFRRSRRLRLKPAAEWELYLQAKVSMCSDQRREWFVSVHRSREMFLWNATDSVRASVDLAIFARYEWINLSNIIEWQTPAIPIQIVIALSSECVPDEHRFDVPLIPCMEAKTHYLLWAGKQRGVRSGQHIPNSLNATDLNTFHAMSFSSRWWNGSVPDEKMR